MKKKKTVHKVILMVIGFILALIFISPILILVNSSFKSLQEIYLDILALPKRFSFQNYVKAFEQMDFSEVPDQFTCNYMCFNGIDYIDFIHGSMGSGAIQNKDK